MRERYRQSTLSATAMLIAAKASRIESLANMLISETSPNWSLPLNQISEKAAQIIELIEQEQQ